MTNILPQVLALTTSVLSIRLLIRLRQIKRLLATEAINLSHIEALEKTLSATSSALDQQKEVTKAMFDLLLAQVSATNDLNEENGRLERELAMAEEKIHVLTPVVSKKKKQIAFVRRVSAGSK